MKRAALHLCLAYFACACMTARCGGASPEAGAARSATESRAAEQEVQVQAKKEKPPAPGKARDIRFPPIARTEHKSGLEINTVELRELPIVHIELTVNSGSADDPARMPGMARLTAAMLKEGTKKRSSAALAEAVDFLGAHLSVDSGQETTVIRMRALSEHLEQALGIVAEIAMRPAFSKQELGKLKKRELQRLALRSQNPNFLAAREFYKNLYGQHPYAHIDTTADVVKRVTREQLERWHRAHFAPNNAFLVVAGDASTDQVEQSAARAFRGWYRRKIREPARAQPPARTDRTVVLVDRPQSVQSVIFIGALALKRKNPDYVPLLVANQVLGGSAASRLFMDLREKRGLTYGTYSHVYEKVDIGPFRVYAAVRNQATAEALSALMTHLKRISKQAASAQELAAAKRYLTDSFPLLIDTPSKIADLVTDLRVFGLADDYWDSFRSQIAQTAADQALQAAQKYIRPEQALIVVVGKAAEIKQALDPYGPVTVIDSDGELIMQAQVDNGKRR